MIIHENISNNSLLVLLVSSIFVPKDSFYDFSSSSNTLVDMASEFSFSFAYWGYKAKYSAESKTTTSSASKTRTLVASMRIERYYSSVKEERSIMKSDAITMLSNKDYVGFFTSCGPTYIRSLRRAQEVTAFLNFKSTNSESASSYVSSVQTSTWYGYGSDSSSSSSSQSSSESKSLKITIQGYGLGLTVKGSETLIATSIEEFQGVMKFAYNSMTRVKDTVNIGMVYGMEVIPWVNNPQFQLNAAIDDEIIEVPVIRSLIPKAINLSDPSDTYFNNTARENYRCKEPTFAIDKFGACCEFGELYDFTEKQYNLLNPHERVCRPVRVIDSSLMKENMAANGEFVASLTRTSRYKLDRVNIVDKCIAATKALPERNNWNFLQSNLPSAGMDAKYTVFELKMALDPFNDYSVVKQMAKELEEFLEMFYQPCLNAIYGSHIGTSPETDPVNFMAFPWHSHEECTRLSCFGNGMRWDRENGGGCVPGIMHGVNALPYNVGGGESSCIKDDTDPFSDVNECKYNSTEMNTLQGRIKECWSSSSAAGSIDYFIDNFCLPKFTTETLDKSAIAVLRQSFTSKCTTMQEKSLNVAYYKPTTQSSTYVDDRGSAVSSLAVDGNTNGFYWRRSVMHTKLEPSPWWSVDLQQAFTIKKIVVHNRADCCQYRLQGFKISLLNAGTEVWSETQTGTLEQITTITSVEDQVGDQIIITLQGRTEYLQLAEVEVFNKYFV